MSGAVDSAWQAALAAEYAAIFGYGVLGPRLQDPAELALARACEQAHRDLANEVELQIAATGQTPPAPRPSYVLPFPVTDPATAHRLAVRLEEATAAAWRYLIATAANPSLASVSPTSVSPTSTSPAPPSPASATEAPAASSGVGLAILRAGAVQRLSAAAVRALGWRRIVTPLQPSVAFPGI